MSKVETEVEFKQMPTYNGKQIGPSNRGSVKFTYQGTECELYVTIDNKIAVSISQNNEAYVEIDILDKIVEELKQWGDL